MSDAPATALEAEAPCAALGGRCRFGCVFRVPAARPVEDAEEEEEDDDDDDDDEEPDDDDDDELWDRSVEDI